MIFHKVQKGLDWLVFSILDNVCTRKFCKSNGYWKYVNNFKQMYNKSMWFSENKKKPPVKILSMADTGIILFICINSFTILINLLTILDAIAIKTDIEEYDFFNNKMVLGLLIIILCIMIYFTYHVFIAYIIHSGFISGYQNRYGDNLKPPTNVYHRMTA